MRRTRRQFVTLTALTAGLAACGAGSRLPVDTGADPLQRPDEPPPWVPPGVLDEEAFAWSVQCGDATADGALLSIRTTEARVDVIVVAEAGGGWAEVGRLDDVATEGEAVRVGLEGLQPDTAHRFVATTPDGRRSRVGRFRTALPPGLPRRLQFGATSCMGTTNPTWPSLAGVAERGLDLFLLLGDAVYADGSGSLEEYRVHWRRTLATDTFRDLSASTSLFAVWDDHEVDNNWYAEGLSPTDPFAASVSPERLALATEAFREAIPHRLGSGRWGVWRRQRWGDALEIIALDTRTERDGATRIVGDEQLAWAIDAVTSSRAAIKVVMSSVHLADHTDLWGPLLVEDRWQGYPEQRLALVEALDAVPGVVVITGDMHYGAIHRLGRAGEAGHGVWEIAAGPSGSALAPVGAATPDPRQYLRLLQAWSCCLFTADPDALTLTVEFVGDDGQPLVHEVLDLA